MIMSWWSRNSRLLLILLSTGWILWPSDASAQSSGVTRDIETEYNKSVVRIFTSGRDVQGRPKAEYGTGIFVSEGTILTAGHVVGRDDEWYQNAGRPDRQVDVMVVDDDNAIRTLAQGAAVRIDPNLDIALVFVNPVKRSSAEIDFTDRKENSSAYAFVWDKAATVPEVRSADIVRTDVPASGPGLRLAGQFRQGHSGAPVFDLHGRVIGIIVKGDDTNQYTLAVPIAACRTLLSSAPKFSEFRRFRSRSNERISVTSPNGDALRLAALTQVRRTVRDEAAGFVEGFFFERGSRIGPEKATELADAVIVVDSEQSEARHDGYIDLTTRSSGILEVASLDTMATKLAGSIQAEELQRARAREHDLLLEIDRLKSKLAGVEKAGGGTTVLQKEIGEALTGKSDELRSNDLFRRALVAQSLGRAQQAVELFDKLVNDYPKLESARVQRGRPEDNAYLVAARSAASSDAYRAVAQAQFENDDSNNARETLRQLRSLFPNQGVVEVSLVSSALRDIGPTIVDYLTLWRPDRSYMPPWSLKRRGLVVRNDSIILFPAALDFEEYPEFTLRFERYGYKSCSVKIERGELRPNETIKKLCSIERDENPPVGNYQISGTALLSDKDAYGGISVAVVNHGKLAGFGKIIQTNSSGQFKLDNLPEGDGFQLSIWKDGYVRREVSFKLHDGNVICWHDKTGRYLGEAREHQCDFAGFEFRLYPVRQVAIEWQLQETPGLRNFEGSVSKGRVALFAALQYDWRRGGWSCCQASYRFGSQQIDAELPDVIAFTDLDGRIFLAQPPKTAQPSNSVARLPVDYDQLVELPDAVEFSVAQEIVPGATYLIKTVAGLEGQDFHYAKLRILSVK